MVGFFNFGSFGGGSASSGALAIDASGSIPVSVGSEQEVDITCNQDVTSLVLAFRVETLAKVDVALVADGAISRANTVATLALTTSMTSSERTLRWSLTNTSTGEAVASGLMFITYDAQGD